MAHPFHIHVNPFLTRNVQDQHDVDVTEREIGNRSSAIFDNKQGYTYS